MTVSVEVPVFKGHRLQRCIDSVLYQSSKQWRLSLLWDGGDAESRRILTDLDRQKRPNVTVHFRENRGIARARRFLTEHSRGEFILPLDDDDSLPFNAVERLLEVAAERPWAAVIRAQRKIMDEDGRILDTPPWFPFEPRHYQRGMVTDITNHAQPYLIRRSAYERTTGWEGFEDFRFAGEDCDLYLKLEEAGTIELVDEVLYYYRVHGKRASLVLTDQAAYEMWRRLADKTIARIGLPLRRVNDTPPFRYEPLPRPESTPAMLDVLIVGSTGTPEADRVMERLSRSGVAEDGRQIIAPDPAAFNAAVRRTSRPILLVVDAGVDLDDAGGLGALLRAMNDNDADLIRLPTPDGDQASPTDARFDDRLILARREVANASGGMDEGYGDWPVAMADFCLKARQRDFRVVSLTVDGIIAGTPRPLGRNALDRLTRKWADYPHLFH